MKRAVITVTVLHLVWVLVLIGTAILVLLQTRKPEIGNEPDAARGLLIGAAVVAIPAIPQLLGVWGLWKRKPLGWWLALVMDILLVMTLAYSMVDDNEIDMEQFGPTICVAALAIVLLLPWVRKQYLRRAAEPASAS